MIGFKDNNEVERINLRKWAVEQAVRLVSAVDPAAVLAAAQLVEAYVLSDIEKPAPTQLVVPITVTVNPPPADPVTVPSDVDAAVAPAEPVPDQTVTPTTIAATP